MRIRPSLVLAALGALPVAHAHEPQSTTPATAQANRAVAAAYDLAQPQDLEDASRGLVATLPGGVIRGAQGNIAWDGGQIAFIRGAVPDSVNPKPNRLPQNNENQRIEPPLRQDVAHDEHGDHASEHEQ